MYCVFKYQSWSQVEFWLYLAFQTATAYFTLYIIIECPRFEYMKKYLDNVCGLDKTPMIYGSILSAVFPGIVLLQNLFASLLCYDTLTGQAFILSLFSKSFLNTLKTNYTIFNTVYVFGSKKVKTRPTFIRTVACYTLWDSDSW